MQKILISLFVCFICLSIHAEEKKGQRALFATRNAMGTPRVVVLDPGHGGTDRGARSKMPFCEEKRLCLQAARLVKQYLEQLGYRVVMTRETDAFIPLSRRVEVAHQSQGDIFVSLHFNASRNPDAHGIEIFACESKKNKRVIVASNQLAHAILSPLLLRTGAQSRGVKKGNFYVIRETQIPAVLIEGGFISNPSERMLLKSAPYQEKIARGIAQGIDTYFRKNKKKLARISKSP